MVACKIQIPKVGGTIPGTRRENITRKPWIWFFSLSGTRGHVAGNNAHYLKKESRLESVLVELRHEVNMR